MFSIPVLCCFFDVLCGIDLRIGILYIHFTADYRVLATVEIKLIFTSSDW